MSCCSPSSMVSSTFPRACVAFNAYLTSHFVQLQLHRSHAGGDLPYAGHPDLVGCLGKGNLPDTAQQGMFAGTGSPSWDRLTLTRQGQSQKHRQADFEGKRGYIQGGEKLTL